MEPNYSEDENSAMEMVKKYVMMIEGIKPHNKDVPSQDREEMIAFLDSKKGTSQRIYELSFLLRGYEEVRQGLRRVQENKRHIESNLFRLLGGGLQLD
jgi:hypothetical protein